MAPVLTSSDRYTTSQTNLSVFGHFNSWKLPSFRAGSDVALALQPWNFVLTAIGLDLFSTSGCDCVLECISFVSVDCVSVTVRSVASGTGLLVWKPGFPTSQLCGFQQIT